MRGLSDAAVTCAVQWHWHWHCVEAVLCLMTALLMLLLVCQDNQPSLRAVSVYSARKTLASTVLFALLILGKGLRRHYWSAQQSRVLGCADAVALSFFKPAFGPSGGTCTQH